MTQRTRWDALAEELAAEDTAAKLEAKNPLEVKKQRPKLTPEGEAKVRALRAVYAPARRDASTPAVLVTVDGRAIPVDDFRMTQSRDLDLELIRLGALSDEELGRRVPTKVTGSFITTGDSESRLGGRELMIFIKQGGEPWVIRAHVISTRWTSDGPCEVEFVGTQVD